MVRIEDLGTALVVASSLLAIELTMSYAEPMLSGDVAHIQSIGSVSERLASGTAPYKVLLLGNSMTGEGIDIAVADSIFDHGLGVPTDIYAVHPDGSGIAEWVHIATHSFFERGSSPDLLVVPFAWNLLADDNEVRGNRIARWYLHRPQDWGDFLRHDTQDFEGAAHAVFSRASVAFANRDRIRNRLLAALPGYEEMAEGLSRGRGDANSADTTPLRTQSTYSRLERLARASAQSGTHLVLVAMPVRQPYQLDGGLITTAAELGVPIIDARDTEGITADSFRDAIHLAPEGARIATQRIGEDLTAVALDHTSPLGRYSAR